MTRKLFILGSLACLGLASSARAAIIYTYSAVPQNTGTADLTNAAPGTYTLNLYLNETLTNGSTSVIQSNNFSGPGTAGLFSAGVAVVENTGGTGATPTGATPNLLASPAGFDSSGSHFSGKNTGTVPAAYIAETTDLNDNSGDTPTITSTVGTTTTNLYLLGTATLTVAAGANATFLVESLHDAPHAPPAANNDGILNAGSNGNTLDFGGDDMDAGTPAGPGATPATGANGNPTTFAVTSPIPEPGSLMMCGLIASGLAFRRRRAEKA